MRFNGFTVKTVLSHPRAAGFQQFKQQVENVTAIFFLPLQSMHQIPFCLVIQSQTFPKQIQNSLKLQPQCCFLHCLVFSLIPSAWAKGSKMWSVFQQCSRATLHLCIWSNKTQTNTRSGVLHMWLYHNAVKTVNHYPFLNLNCYYPLKRKLWLTSFAKEYAHRTTFCIHPICWIALP